MFANELVCVGYQTCAWLTPRITNADPFASTTRVPLTRRPTGADWAAGTWTSIEHTMAMTVATAARRTTLFIRILNPLIGSRQPSGLGSTQHPVRRAHVVVRRGTAASASDRLYVHPKPGDVTGAVVGRETAQHQR